MRAKHQFVSRCDKQLLTVTSQTSAWDVANGMPQVTVDHVVCQLKQEIQVVINAAELKALQP